MPKSVPVATPVNGNRVSVASIANLEREIQKLSKTVQKLRSKTCFQFEHYTEIDSNFSKFFVFSEKCFERFWILFSLKCKYVLNISVIRSKFVVGLVYNSF